MALQYRDQKYRARHSRYVLCREHHHHRPHYSTLTASRRGVKPHHQWLLAQAARRRARFTNAVVSSCRAI